MIVAVICGGMTVTVMCGGTTVTVMSGGVAGRRFSEGEFLELSVIITEGGKLGVAVSGL